MLRSRAGRRLVALPFGLTLLVGGVARAGTVDVALERMLDARITRAADAPPTCRVCVDDRGLVHVPVIVDGDPARVVPAIAAAGGRVRAVVSARHVTADLPLATARAVARTPGVRHVKAGARVRTCNDMGSLPGGVGVRGPEQLTLGPPYASSDPRVARARGGEGVVVALVDTGVDITHPDLRHPDGSTRLLAYWDQSDPTTLRDDQPDGFGYGRVYERAELNAILEGRGELAPTARDTDGHGTHVAGTLAGGGLARVAPPYMDHQFTGVAPRAALVAVKFDFEGARGDTTALVDAVAFCFRRAGPSPCVVNLSLGTPYGPHDGSTLEERALDALAGPGRVVVVAAGNGGATETHGAGTLAPDGASEVTVDLTADGSTEQAHAFLDVWYPGAARCDVEVVTPAGEVVRDARWRTAAGGAGRATRHGTVFVYNGGDRQGWASDNGDHELYVELRGEADAPLTPGRWTVRLRGLSGPARARYDGWHGLSPEVSRSRVRYEGRLADDRMTVGAPATGRRMLAIGAYVTRTAWSTGRGDTGSYDAARSPAIVGDLAFFSSRGPARDGRRLPHVTAPGMGVISSLSRDARREFAPRFIVGSWQRPGHAVLQGTSMAAPHAAGVVALALAIDPTLGPEELTRLLPGAARVDDHVRDSLFARDTGPVPNDDWGAGKLDAPRLLAAVAARVAPTSPTAGAATTTAAPLTDAPELGPTPAAR